MIINNWGFEPNSNGDLCGGKLQTELGRYTAGGPAITISARKLSMG